MKVFRLGLGGTPALAVEASASASVPGEGEELKIRCRSLVRVVLPDDEGPEMPMMEAISIYLPPTGSKQRFVRGMPRAQEGCGIGR